MQVGHTHAHTWGERNLRIHTDELFATIVAMASAPASPIALALTSNRVSCSDVSSR